MLLSNQKKYKVLTHPFMRKIFLLFHFLLFLVSVNAQTFNGTGGTIPDFPGGQQCFNLNVTGLSSNLYSNYGLTAVTINITHPYDGDLEVVLISPNGVQTILSSNNGGAGANYTSTVFTMGAGTSITAGVAPFTGNFIPEESFYAQNVGQNGNGTWQLCITDEINGDVGSLVSWSLTFAGGAIGSPDPGPNPVATDGCAGAPLICNLNGYTGSTYSTYTFTPANEPSGTAQPSPGPAGTFCGTNVNNSSWIRFQASASSVSLGINIFNCTGSISPLGEHGIQLALYNACGAPWAYSPSSLPPNNSIGPAPNDENVPSCYGDGLFGYHTLDFNNLVVGNIYYIMFDGWNGNQCDYTITVNNGVQVVNITPSANPICEGDTINLVASAPGVLNTFAWSSVPSSVIPSTSTVQVHPVASTVYTVVASGICGSQSASIPITVIPSGNPAWSAPAPVCANTNPFDLAALITGTTGGSWTGTGVVGSTFNPAGLNGSYLVTYTTGTSPCQKSQSHSIVVKPTPAPNISIASSTSICSYQSVFLTASSVVGGTYTWSTGDTGTSIHVTSSGNYWVQVLNGNGCSNSDTLAVAVTNYPSSNPVIVPTTPVICNGQPVILSTTVPFSSYTWSTSASTPSISVNVAGPYSVIVQDANGCLDTSNTNVIASNINVSITGDSVLCAGEVSVLTANGGSGYTWNTSAITTTININAPGNYFVSSTNADGCTDTDTTTVISSLINIYITGDSVLCPGETTGLTANGGSSYTWNTSATSNSINTATAGNYSISSTNADGCSDQDTLVVVQSIFNPAISGDTILCPGALVDLTASGGNSYTWNTSATTAHLQVPIVATTVYSVVISNADGCMDTLATTVHIYTDYYAAPVLLPDADTTAANQTVHIVVTNNDIFTGSFSIADPPNHGTASVVGNEIIYTPNNGYAGFDTLIYISCDPSCINICDTALVIIKVNSNILFFPEFISPNGDNSNEFWYLGELAGYPNNELTIMNRWGDALYHAQPYNNDWNGQSNMGIPSMTEGVTDGTYFFVFIPYPGDEPVKGFIEIRK
jgi:gliding motility-associated-like protein